MSRRRWWGGALLLPTLAFVTGFRSAPPIWALGVSRGVSSGSSARLLESQNGGANWTVLQKRLALFSPPVMLSKERGFVAGIGANGVYYAETRDGGAHWAETPSTNVPAFGFLDSRLGWLSLTKNPAKNGPTRWTLLATTDGGQVWQRRLSKTLPGLSTTSSPFFLTSRLGWILDEIGAAWTVWRTMDGGHHFRRISPRLGDAGVAPVGITFTTPKRGWILAASTAGGSAGVNYLMTSTDGGSTWGRAQGLPKLPTVEHLDFLTPQDGWILAPMRVRTGSASAVDVGTRIYRTVNGGRTWVPVYATGGRTLSDLIFVSPRVGYATAGATVLVTRDAGASWSLAFRAHRIDLTAIWSLNRYSRESQ